MVSLCVNEVSLCCLFQIIIFQNALSFTGANESAVLQVHNLHLEDPASGTFLTEFPVFNFSNITVEVSDCCNLLDHLVDGQDGLSGEHQSKDFLLKALENKTWCYPNQGTINRQPTSPIKCVPGLARANFNDLSNDCALLPKLKTITCAHLGSKVIDRIPGQCQDLLTQSLTLHIKHTMFLV